MNGDRPNALPAASANDGQRPDPLVTENEALRAEVLRLRRLEQRHLQELAQFARIAEGKRPGWPQIRAGLGNLRARAARWARHTRRAIVARMPARLKATLRRLQTRLRF